MELLIRAAHISDLPHIYDICLKTGFSGADATDLVSDRFIIGQYFAAPYIHYETDLCFVITTGSTLLGYILGVSISRDFNAWMNKTWLPAIREYYPLTMTVKSDFEKFMIETIHKECIFPDFLEGYPSHLHIDLLPAAQRKGLGTKLIEKLIEKLQVKGSPGLHLAVGEKNTNAIQFYNRTGFSTLLTKPGSVYMGRDL